MGYLHNWPITFLVPLNVKGFVETGTQAGAGLQHALDLGVFDVLHSIEINPGFYDMCTKKFEGHDNVNLHLGSSVDMLPKVLEQIKDVESCFWWLDAHLPELIEDTGFDFDETSHEIALPMKAELEIITANRDISNDVFLMDDLRIYENPPGSESLSDSKLSPDLRLSEEALSDLHRKYPDFFPHKQGAVPLTNIIKETHDTWAIWLDQGYLISFPRAWTQTIAPRMEHWLKSIGAV